MSVNEFLEKIKNKQPVGFSETMSVINENYVYQPCQFHNGLADERLVNEAGTNEGSCRIFAFAQIHQLDQQETLDLFGDYYRQDVLGNPNGKDHQNIRNFMKFGWAGLEFEGQALTPKV